MTKVWDLQVKTQSLRAQHGGIVSTSSNDRREEGRLKMPPPRRYT
jgi:hypothetical protein